RRDGSRPARRRHSGGHHTRTARARLRSGSPPRACPQAWLRIARARGDRRDRCGGRTFAEARRRNRGGAVTARGLIVSAPRSSSGKTLVTLGLLGALRRKGVAVRAAKSGPDYIDPAFHAAATGAKGVNLDSWAMPVSLIDALIADTTKSAEVLVIEGAMGLFDGVPGTPGRSCAASCLAARLGPPVLLILDVSGQSQSAAAVAAGFASYNPAVRVGGVVLNKLGSDRHRTLIADALKPLGTAVLGAIPRDETLLLPERHLGLVQASEHADLAARLERFADVAARHLDLAAFLAVAAALCRLQTDT